MCRSSEMGWQVPGALTPKSVLLTPGHHFYPNAPLGIPVRPGPALPPMNEGVWFCSRSNSNNRIWLKVCPMDLAWLHSWGILAWVGLLANDRYIMDVSPCDLLSKSHQLCSLQPPRDENSYWAIGFFYGPPRPGQVKPPLSIYVTTSTGETRLYPTQYLIPRLDFSILVDKLCISNLPQIKLYLAIHWGKLQRGHQNHRNCRNPPGVGDGYPSAINVILNVCYIIVAAQGASPRLRIY